MRQDKNHPSKAVLTVEAEAKEVAEERKPDPLEVGRKAMWSEMSTIMKLPTKSKQNLENESAFWKNPTIKKRRTEFIYE